MKFLTLLTMCFSFSIFAAELKLKDPAPMFKAKTQTGADFDLSSRKGYLGLLAISFAHVR